MIILWKFDVNRIKSKDSIFGVEILLFEEQGYNGNVSTEEVRMNLQRIRGEDSWRSLQERVEAETERVNASVVVSISLDWKWRVMNLSCTRLSQSFTPSLSNKWIGSTRKTCTSQDHHCDSFLSVLPKKVFEETERLLEL